MTNSNFGRNLDPLTGMANDLPFVEDNLFAIEETNGNSIVSPLNRGSATLSAASVNHLVTEADTLAIASQETEPLRVFILDPEQLKLTKQLVQNGDPRIAPAIATLKQQADQALNQKPLTVVDGKAPPSGDPNDYMSLSIYWWPNPDTPDGLPYVERDGQRNPEINQYDGPKLNLMASTVETLALAYYLTDHEPYAAHAARLLKTWFIDEQTRMNPNLKHGQMIPGKNTGSRQGIIETVVLATEVIDSVGLLAGSESWTPADQTQLQSWFESYREWLQTSWLGIQEAFRTNNHGMWYDVQLASFARFVGDDAAAKQRLTYITPLRISSQVESDGSQPQELSRASGFDYSLYNLEAMFTLASIGEKLGVDLWNSPDDGGIEKALNFLLPYIEPSKQWSYGQSNIDLESLYPFLRQAALAYQDPSYEQLIDKLPAPANVRATKRVNLLHPDPELVPPTLQQNLAASPEANGVSLVVPEASLSSENLLNVGEVEDLRQEGVGSNLGVMSSGEGLVNDNMAQNGIGQTLLNVGNELLGLFG